MQRSNPKYTPRIDQLLPGHWSLLNLYPPVRRFIDLLSDEDEALSHYLFNPYLPQELIKGPVIIYTRGWGRREIILTEKK
jgi:hypothetical protein